MNNIVRTIIAAIVAALAFTLVPATAHADNGNQQWESAVNDPQFQPSYTAKYPTLRLHRATRKMDRRDRAIVSVRETHHGKRVTVRFNNGSKWDFKPCRYEDSERCYWNAKDRGNGVGKSFVRVWGKTFRVVIKRWESSL